MSSVSTSSSGTAAGGAQPSPHQERLMSSCLPLTASTNIILTRSYLQTSAGAKAFGHQTSRSSQTGEVRAPLPLMNRGVIHEDQAFIDEFPIGGRTAWSCVVSVAGAGSFPARFWYDGTYINNAREDAAEKALQMLGVIPAPATPATPAQQQPRGGQYYGAIHT